ncbi:hypothetical protein BpHYR1_019369 [Brachionus plicatilis]|uniref:Uncharacterized protein n=1 Tax=Brachionus plicatilis TaxID=10195 RepID=A0A3M7R2N8_BRAPC|nr:hypothetical protein BpHYR1_019369 [Brachionus plicatilis]
MQCNEIIFKLMFKITTEFNSIDILFSFLFLILQLNYLFAKNAFENYDAFIEDNLKIVKNYMMWYLMFQII